MKDSGEQIKGEIKATLRTLDGFEYCIPVGEALPPIECFRCGICCTCYQPLLAPGEVETIADGLGLSVKDFLSRYTQLTVVGYLVRQTKKGCIFLRREDGRAGASCRIYSLRPGVCRNWVPSLSRRECQEGLARRHNKDKIMLPQELYPSQESVDSFCSALSDERAGCATIKQLPEY